MREVLEQRFRKPFPKVRPAFLEYPPTGRRLELDAFCAELMLAAVINLRRSSNETTGKQKSVPN